MFARLADDLREHPSRWAAALLFGLMLFPFLDLPLSRTFYIPGRGFTWDTDGLLEFVRSAVPDIVIGSFGFCFGLWLTGLMKPDWPWRLSTPRITYLWLTLVIGPGLIVEALLKPIWGRARPKDIVDFGGEAAYTLPWLPADQCDSNCSFVSGHAAVAFWVTAYAAFLPPKKRAWGVFAGVTFGLAIGFVRIAQGGHFFSDTVAAGFIVVVVNAVVARLILNRAPPV
jgi:lipid A 4'-phosphatase